MTRDEIIDLIKSTILAYHVHDNQDFDRAAKDILADLERVGVVDTLSQKKD